MILFILLKKRFMKNLIIIILISFLFNACSYVQQYKINSNFEFEKIPLEQQKVVKIQIQEDEINEFDEFSDLELHPFDPLKSYNKFMTGVNDSIYINLFDPVLKTYVNVVNENVRVSVSNFFYNLQFPVRFINNILQFKFKNATEELASFITNSTIGMLGLFDIASNNFKLKKHKEDFGQTLGFYGASDGLHIVLPILGPSNLRDSIGLFADSYINPLNNQGSLKYKIPNNIEKSFGIFVINSLNKNSFKIGEYQSLKKDAIELYPFLKDIYEQSRNKKIKD